MPPSASSRASRRRTSGLRTGCGIGFGKHALVRPVQLRSLGRLGGVVDLGRTLQPPVWAMLGLQLVVTRPRSARCFNFLRFQTAGLHLADYASLSILRLHDSSHGGGFTLAPRDKVGDGRKKTRFPRDAKPEVGTPKRNRPWIFKQDAGKGADIPLWVLWCTVGESGDQPSDSLNGLRECHSLGKSLPDVPARGLRRQVQRRVLRY